jgi:hypothetical protein
MILMVVAPRESIVRDDSLLTFKGAPYTFSPFPGAMRAVQRFLSGGQSLVFSAEFCGLGSIVFRLVKGRGFVPKVWKETLGQ